MLVFTPGEPFRKLPVLTYDGQNCTCRLVITTLSPNKAIIVSSAAILLKFEFIPISNDLLCNSIMMILDSSVGCGMWVIAKFASSQAINGLSCQIRLFVG